MFHRLCIIILLAVFTTACAQQAAFVSTPSGAKVYIDGEQIGVTPCAYDYKLSNKVHHDVTIAKEGYEDVHFVVVTDEVDTAVRTRWLAAGAVWSPLWLGTIFTNKLKDTYDFALLSEPHQLTATAGQITAGEKM